MPIVKSDVLHELTMAICRAVGGGEHDAALVADHLVGANLAGHDSHGVGMLPLYVRCWTENNLQPNNHVKVIKDSGPILVIDGQRGFGQVIAFEAMELGMAKAREEGAAIVALRNSFHIGRIGHWSELCAKNGFASMHYVNVVDNEPIVAMHAAAEPVLSTNPYSAAMPGANGEPLVLLDMATSKIAMGKARVAKNKGVPVPEGSLLDGNGWPTRDPGCMFPERFGALVAMGEHKGSGLALICELFAGALTGGRTLQPEHPRTGGAVNNMLSVIIDPGAIGDAEACQHEAEAMVKTAKSAKARDGFDEVLMPGEPEARQRKQRLEKGVDVDETSWQEILAAAETAGVTASDVKAILDR
ncbi:MAG: malate/lactate/ureidoglycolate dehydrogenase [Alphaproteobacteria bacterium]|nr:malate/lactate/ureidoglycolate dehydrogenase [Alphaproteobacteria bacterium]